MDAGAIGDLMREALFLIISIVSIGVVPSLLVGLIVSVFQAATQINEQTLSFLPRLFTTMMALLLAGPWIVKRLVEFCTNLINSIPILLS